MASEFGHQGPYHTPPELESGTSSRPTTLQDDGTPPVDEGQQSSISSAVRRAGRNVVRWLKGPTPLERQRITPFFPRVQRFPLRLLDRYLPKRRQKIALLVSSYFCWLLTFVSVLHHSALSSEIDGYGKPLQLSCAASYWAAGNGCGLNGNLCRPFDNSTLAFRCPANCASVKVLNARAVGNQEIIYRQLVIGGPTGDGPGLPAENYYRGDSFICGAAIHSGIVSNSKGGCGVLRLVGKRDIFVSSLRNKLWSIGFDSTFPLSFSFEPNIDSQCKDLRWPLLAVSVIFTCLLSIFTTSPIVFFGTIFVAIYFHVGMASDPPSLSDYYTVVSLLAGRFLPAAFVGFVMYKYYIRRTLEGLDAQLEKTILWVGGCWVGALTNYTFAFIPISRLTPHDVNQQPGAKAALVLIVLILFSIALGQVWYLRLEGRLPRYLALYIFFGITLGLFVAIPGLNLRIHHYILALLLLPGTSMQTRPSLLYQGILVGFFINGIARWGFDSILQTPAALQGDGKLSSALPVIVTPSMTAENITFTWDSPSIWSNENGTFDGMSVLVNDVERYQGYQGYDAQSFTWERALDEELPYYFRFAFMQGSSAGDYTKAGVWEVNGSWTEMPPGPS